MPTHAMSNHVTCRHSSAGEGSPHNVLHSSTVVNIYNLRRKKWGGSSRPCRPAFDGLAVRGQYSLAADPLHAY